MILETAVPRSKGVREDYHVWFRSMVILSLSVILSLFNGIGAAIRLSPNTQPNISEVGPIALMADVIRVGDV